MAGHLTSRIRFLLLSLESEPKTIWSLCTLPPAAPIHDFFNLTISIFKWLNSSWICLHVVPSAPSSSPLFPVKLNSSLTNPFPTPVPFPLPIPWWFSPLNSYSTSHHWHLSICDFSHIIVVLFQKVSPSYSSVEKADSKQWQYDI